METFFIISIGSVIGFVIAYGIITLMGYIPIQDFVGTPVLSLQVTAATIFVLSVIGFVSGVMPARRAANLDVVECLRT